MTFAFTLLGTGSPRPSPQRSQPANVLHTDRGPLLLDAGEATLRQLMRLDISPSDIRAILFTHMHKDHILGYPAVVWGGWTLGRPNLEVTGPPGTRRMHELIFDQLYADDIEYSKGIGFEAEALAGVDIHEIESGARFQTHGLDVRTTRTIHSFYNLAYRFEQDGASVVFTGDTTYCEDVVELAAGADVLVCEVTLATSPQYDNDRGRRILDLLKKDHCDPAMAGRMASEAGVGRLVVNHLIPGARTDLICEGCASEFDGPITVGEDLMTFSV